MNDDVLTKEERELVDGFRSEPCHAWAYEVEKMVKVIDRLVGELEEIRRQRATGYSIQPIRESTTLVNPMLVHIKLPQIE